MANTIITIGRECGSGGHTIGKLTAERLGLPFYDKELVEMVAAKTKLSPEFVRSHGEYFYNGALGHIIGYGTRFESLMSSGSLLTDQIHQAQCQVLREVAQQGDCVVVGRCAGYVLQKDFNALKVFIHSAMPYKVERSVREHGLEAWEAEEILLQRDKARAQHHKFYTGQVWGQSCHYDLCLDSGRLGEAACVDMIAVAYYLLREQDR